MDNSRATPPPVDEATAEIQDKALAVVQRLLKDRGIHARCHHTISLGLFASREAAWPDKPPLRSWMDRYPPELAVAGPQGWRDATVTVGPRSGHYLVSLRNGPDLQKVRSDRPEKVVDLILSVRGRS
ncbi:hypothetical protein FHR32_006740 [Streptosporangium album]|uniref:Uncharacterized protein n=1 Tax=Streptosporangium album TaxID=47479 RepID=A0A7W7S1T6_9ACTN|nr:hypothetical protein [Streptosporangium album]